MKIVYVATRPQVNGATKVAIMHCNLLQKRNHQVRLCVLGAGSLAWASPNVPVEYVSSFRKIVLEDKELIVALDCFSAVWFTQQYGIKRVISFIQTNEPKLYTDAGLVDIAKKAFALKNPKIVVSKYLHEVLQSYGSDSCIIPPACDRTIFYPAERKLPYIGKPFRVLTVGSYGHPLKQIPQAFEAVSFLKKAGVDVRLIRLVRKEEIEKPEEIETQWYVNPPQYKIGDIYRKSDVLLFPSSSEGFGLPILEAMMSGIPFITTDNGGSRDIVPDALMNSLIEIGDTIAMGKALYKIATEESRFNTLRQLGLEQAEKWSWEKTCNALEEFFMRIRQSIEGEEGGTKGVKCNVLVPDGVKKRAMATIPEFDT